MKNYNPTTENQNHVNSIRDELEKIYNGEVMPDDYNERIADGEEPDDIEPLTLWDYFNDVYNIEYRVDSKHADSINSVEIMVACGGPNIYIDTGDRKVKLYWWTEYAEAEISREVCDAINDIFDELWNC